MDPRLTRYARILVDDCIDVQPGWQVLVVCQPLGRPLVDEVVRRLAQKGAYALVRYRFESGGDSIWQRQAPLELVGTPPSIVANDYESADAYIVIVAPENTREGADVPRDRLSAYQRAMRTLSQPYLADEKKWVGTFYPTPAYAQDAGMTMTAYEEFVYGSVLIDWPALERDMAERCAHFDAASEVRVVAEGTDITFSIAGRHGKVSAADANMPSGEFFFSPHHESVEGVVSFSEYPACYLGHHVDGVRLRYEGGVIVDASAESDEEFLIETLDADEGARRLGEFGVGCNPGIQRHVRNTLYDEKMDGTVHFAIGQSFPQLGGTNMSAVHWDMVKDLRRGGTIELDGKVVQKDGTWLI